MIHVCFSDSGKQLSLCMQGHAQHNPGNDIVCAAASALGQTLVFALEGVEDITLDVRASKGNLYVAATPTAETVTMFSMTHTGLLALGKKYPKNVVVKGEILPYTPVE
jgi:uncharacterized protein YsxB (DUF464 family)